MSHATTEDLNIEAFEPMPSPNAVKARLPATDKAATVVTAARSTLRRILDREDPRLFVVVGPCSIHDPIAGRDYAARLKRLADAVADTLVLIMRVYFEKPRTAVGWKGHINDPRMDGSFQVAAGMESARRFLLEVAELGLPAATEALDPIGPQYLGDLITWTAIGARTSESQTHREMASGLSTPVGFKNGTDGESSIAINAIVSASHPHRFLGINGDGCSAVIRTRGNRYGHLVLRGGGGRPNYDRIRVAHEEKALAAASLPQNLVIDCSHANSSKMAENQPRVLADVITQIRDGNRSVIGMMLESNIEWGNQSIPTDLSQLKYGCSVTDACIDWDTTERILVDARAVLRDVLPHRRT